VIFEDLIEMFKDFLNSLAFEFASSNGKLECDGNQDNKSIKMYLMGKMRDSYLG
jgi:hypothetical protein